MESIMLTHEEKLNLVLSLIATGCTDPDAIIHCINKIDGDLFKKDLPPKSP